MKKMKNFKLFINESVRDEMKPRSKEEIDLAWQNMIDKIFEKALTSEEGDINLDSMGEEWYKYSEKYHLYDDYYIYKDQIMYMITYETGGWYVTKLRKLNDSKEEFKQKTIKKYEDIKSALKKL